MALNTKDNRTKRQQYEQIRSTLWTEKASFEPQWRDLANFVKPGRLRRYVTDKNRGDRRNLSILDSTATFALRTLAAGMHSGLTSPSRPWFLLTTPDPDLSKYRPVKQWLSDVTEILAGFMILSNIYTALPTLYGDEGLFATGCMGIEEDERELFRCYPYPIGTYALGLSRRQTVDTFIRDFSMTVRQLVDEYGLDNISKTAKRMWDKGDYEETVEVHRIVSPNPEADGRPGARYLPFLSCHWEGGAEEDRFLRESGFNEFPVVAPRWEAAAEDVFGTDSPGMSVLGDIKGLQIMTRRKAQGVELMINPSVTAPTSLQAIGVNLLPGGVNYTDAISQQQPGIRSVRDVNLPIEEIRMDINDVRYMIQKGFYEPLFLMLQQADEAGASPQKTATEILERKEEKFLALGPVVERNKDELHEPLIDRIYAMADRAGEIPPAPPELQGVKLKVTYQSVMALAQKMAGVSTFRNFLNDVAPLAEVFPEVRYKLDGMKIVDQFADAYGVPPDLLRTTEEAIQLYSEDRKAAAQAQQAETAAMMARGAKDMSAAEQLVPA